MYVNDATRPYVGFEQPRYNFFSEQFTEVEKYKMGRIAPYPDTLWEASSPAESDEEGYEVV